MYAISRAVSRRGAAVHLGTMLPSMGTTAAQGHLSLKPRLCGSRGGRQRCSSGHCGSRTPRQGGPVCEREGGS